MVNFIGIPALIARGIIRSDNEIMGGAITQSGNGAGLIRTLPGRVSVIVALPILTSKKLVAGEIGIIVLIPTQCELSRMGGSQRRKAGGEKRKEKN